MQGDQPPGAVGLPGVAAVLFDAGFTLLAPTRPVAELYLEGARAVGVELDPAAMKARVETCWRDLGPDLRQHEDLRSSEEHERLGWFRFTEAVAAAFPELLERHDAWLADLFGRFDDPEAWRPLPGVPELLDALRARGLTLGVVSNWHAVLHRILEHHGLAEKLDFVLVSSEFGWRKPHPSIFLEGLRRAGVGAADALHVGDSVRDDVLGATALGLRAVLVGGAPVEAGLPAGALRVQHTADLLRLLD